LEEYLEVVDLEAVDLEVVNLEAVDLEAVDLEAVDLEAVDLEAVDLEAVDQKALDGRCAMCLDSIHQLVNSKTWEGDKVTLSLKLLYRTGWWRSISREACRQLKLHSGVNSKS
jgi:uncharacterized protein YjbI with pentapeptide repeats